MYLFNHHVMIINSFFHLTFSGLSKIFFGNLGFELLNGKIKFPKTVKYKGGFCPTPLKMGGGLLPSSLIFKGGACVLPFKKRSDLATDNGGFTVCSFRLPSCISDEYCTHLLPWTYQYFILFEIVYTKKCNLKCNCQSNK